MIAKMAVHKNLNGNLKDKENISKLPKKIPAEKRMALQSSNYGIKQENKKVKIAKCVEKPKVEDEKKKKDEKPKIDSDLLKIVPISKKKRVSPKPFFPNEYSQDIWNYYKTNECSALPKPNYMINQSSLSWNMRSIVVDWLVCVCEDFNMSEEALHLAVNYFDRFLSEMSVIPEKLQLVGASSMLVAGKMEEIYPPMPKEWSYLTCDAYSPRQIKKMEQKIMKVLKYKLQPPTAYTFLRKICADHNIDERTTNFAMYLSELVLLEGKQYLNYKPSELAAASVLLARLYMQKQGFWPQEIEEKCGYTVKHLSPIVESQNATLRTTPYKKGRTIRTKYESPKYERVASIKPRQIKLDF